MNILTNNEIEESLFAVFVKNLPKLTDRDDLKKFLEEEYKVSIREIILLNDYTVLENLKGKLEHYNETHNYSSDQLTSIRAQIDKFSNSIERNGAAVIIFENNEDRLLFFREYFNLKEILYMYFKRHFVYRGKKIYFEPVPSLKMIDWHNAKFSFEKVISNTKLQYIISFIINAFIYFGSFAFILFLSQFTYAHNFVLDSIARNIVLIFADIWVEFILILIISSFRLSDNYLKEILKSYFIAQRSTHNTVFVNLIIFASNKDHGDRGKYSVIFLILLQNIKLAVLARYNFENLFRKLKYYLVKNKISTQETYNNLLGENNFNFMKTFEGFKICFYLTVFSMMVSLTVGIIATIFLFIHLLFIRWGMARSRVTEFNTNYYGFYFTYTLEKEFLNLFKFFVLFILAFVMREQTIYLLESQTIADFVLDIIQTKSFYSKFWVKSNYDEVTFTKKFNDQKFVNIAKYLDEIDLLFKKIKANDEFKD